MNFILLKILMFPFLSNVALAAAVIAYARIEMIPYKLNSNTLYTDTDSAYMTEILDFNLVGSELGQMKDELKGYIIAEALFIRPKKIWLLYY